MKILQVVPYLTKGGAERVVVDLANSLGELGNEVSVLCLHPVDPQLNQKFLIEQVQILFVNSKKLNKALMYLQLPFWILRNWKELRNYDVIHCHLTFGLDFGFWISILKRITRHKSIKLVATGHSVAANINSVQKALIRSATYFFDSFILVGQDTEWEEFILKKKVKNIKVIANGISGTPKPAKVSNLYKDRRWAIGTISRLEAERQPWAFIELFSKIDSLLPGKCHFILAGAGSESNKLIELVHNLGIQGRVSMPGLIYDPSLVFNKIDLYITLNMDSHTGIAGLEAVFAGIPVIGIQLSPSYRDGETDWIWSHQNLSVVAHKVVEYLSNPSQTLEVVKEQNTKIVLDFSVGKMTKEYLIVYGMRAK